MIQISRAKTGIIHVGKKKSEDTCKLFMDSIKLLTDAPKGDA
jgi:hypothetical protein